MPDESADILAKGRGMSRAMYDVIMERHRQVTAEGWTGAHDDAHPRGELEAAAATYLFFGTFSDQVRAAMRLIVPDTWPWEARWWKPRDRRRDLVRGAALTLAAIERLDREAEREAADNVDL